MAETMAKAWEGFVGGAWEMDMKATKEDTAVLWRLLSLRQNR